jgi:hypothetical protein
MVSPLLLDSMRRFVLVGGPQAKIGRPPPERVGLGIPSKNRSSDIGRTREVVLGRVSDKVIDGIHDWVSLRVYHLTQEIFLATCRLPSHATVNIMTAVQKSKLRTRARKQLNAMKCRTRRSWPIYCNPLLSAIPLISTFSSLRTFLS